MKKLINKLEKWLKENPKKAKLLEYISENHFYVMSLTFSLHLAQVGMELGKEHIVYFVVLFIMLESFIYTILAYVLKTFLDKLIFWRKEK